MADANSLLPYLRHPNVRKFLDFIAAAEGADYNTGFGGTEIKDLSAHPNESKSFTNLEGKRLRTTAAGRYQFINSTWKGVAKKLGLPDFSPLSQDLAAVELLREKGALSDILTGNYGDAIRKSNTVWASLPGSPHKQRTVSADFANNFFNTNGVSAVPSSVPTGQDLSQAVGNEGFAIRPEDLLVQPQEPQQPAPNDLANQIATVGSLESPFLEGEGTPFIENEGVPFNVSQSPLAEQLRESLEAEPEDSNINDVLMRSDAQDRINQARQNAVAQFLSGGENDAPPQLEIPRPMRNEINRIMSNMRG